MSRKEKKLVGGFLAVLTCLMLIMGVILQAADEDCRTAYCSPSWGTWHPYYWYFECYKPPCPEEM